MLLTSPQTPLLLLLLLLLFCMLQPAILFVGERFDSEPDFKLAKSMLLDMFRGQQVRQWLQQQKQQSKQQQHWLQVRG
jgi:hypothetical protein